MASSTEPIRPPSDLASLFLIDDTGPASMCSNTGGSGWSTGGCWMAEFDPTPMAGADTTGRRPLRILRVSTDTYPEILGGGALHAHEMSCMQA
jgi:hypothetical protein